MGCKEQLLIDTVANKQAFRYTAYIDHAKVYDSVPHFLLISVPRYTGSTNIRLICWRLWWIDGTMLILKREETQMSILDVRNNRGILQDDYLNPFWYCLNTIAWNWFIKYPLFYLSIIRTVVNKLSVQTKNNWGTCECKV